MRSKILPCGNYVQEDFDSVMKRYSGFGEDLYKKLKDGYPKVFANLTFYRRVDHQVEDSYAVFADNDSFLAIQLDPLCEVIVLWNNLNRIEIGTWSLDQYSDAITFITEQLSHID